MLYQATVEYGQESAVQIAARTVTGALQEIATSMDHLREQGGAITGAYVDEVCQRCEGLGKIAVRHRNGRGVRWPSCPECGGEPLRRVAEWQPPEETIAPGVGAQTSAHRKEITRANS